VSAATAAAFEYEASEEQHLMLTEFRLPELGENIESGELVKLLVSVGDEIGKDQSVLELETDKATIEVPSPTSGRVREIHVNQGDKVKVGQLILTVDDGAGAARVEKAEQPRAAARPAQPKPESRKPPQASSGSSGGSPLAEARMEEAEEATRRERPAAPQVVPIRPHEPEPS